MKPAVENLIFYQIYPKSFCDSNGDGVGDIQGIISKIDYIKKLGVNAVWLTPFFKSPNVDNGYDISDYKDVQSEIGTLKEVEKMIVRFHENGIKVIFDLVANHTSTQHEWFLQSKKSKDNAYRDYYIWRKTPPNDWQSAFGGSAWEYDKQTGEYYLHSYAVEQADLNWDNPKVREEMQAVVDFWLEKGVDGFRCDVLDQISKDWENGINGSGPRLHEYIRQLFGRERTEGIFTVGECWSANMQNMALFCLPERKELTTAFAFSHLCVDDGRFYPHKPPLEKVCRRIADWQISTQNTGVIPTVFFENHDQPRCVSRFGDDKKFRYQSATALASMLLTHRGVPFLMQGQEIGATNSRYDDIRYFNDVESLNYYQMNEGKLSKKDRIEAINFGGRDNARYLMPWEERTQKGWIAPYSRQSEINVKTDLQSKNSVFSFYQKLIELRKNQPCLTKGRYNLLALTPRYYAFERALGNEKMVIVFNFEKESEVLNVGGRLILSNYPSVGEILKPYQIAIYKK